MANIKISRKQFKKDIGKLDEEMQNRIAMFGTPLESFNDNEIELEIFPDRPDLLSYHGFKRSFLSFLEKKTGLKNYNLKKLEENYRVIIDSSVKNIRPYTACAIVKGLKLDDEKIKELIDIQEKLHITIGRKRKKLAIGIYPLEKITLPINYKALEPDKIKFIPLETEREMSGLEILQRHPAGRDYAHLLAGKEKFPIFIDSADNILSMPPIINSQLTGKVTENTRDVFVECSGLDFDILKKCLNIIVTSLAEIGGEIYPMQLNYGIRDKRITPDLTPEKMKISIENTNKLLGLKLTEKEIKKLLEKMGHEYNKGVVSIPAWRVDILHEVDLIEDVAIAYGYDNFEPNIPSIFTIGEEDKKEITKRKISDILTGLNLLEVSNYHLTKKEDQFKKMGFSEKEIRNFVEVENSKTEFTILRKELSHYLLKIFSENVDAEYPQNIFEIGKVFEEVDRISEDKLISKSRWVGEQFRGVASKTRARLGVEQLHDIASKTKVRLGVEINKNLGGDNRDVKEKEHLAVAVIPSNFTQLKQILEYFSKMIGIEIELEEAEQFPSHFIEGRVAEIFIKNKKIGYIGEVHPKILRNWKLKMPVAMFEIDLEEIFRNLK